MKTVFVATLCVGALIAGCAPASQSNADTAAALAQPSTPQTVAAPVDTVSAVTGAAGAGVNKATPAKSGSRVAAPAKSTSSKTQSTGPLVGGDSILGYDRVIRVPPRPVNAASSTPTR